MSYGYLYKTTNLLSNKLYIGQHKGEFDSKYFGSGHGIIRAVKKYGLNNFKVEMVCQLPTREQLDEFEKFMIAKYREIVGRKKMYNMSDGGTGGDNIKFSANPELSRKKISDKLKGHKLSPEHKEKLRLYPRTPEANLKRSIGMKKAIAEGRKIFTNREVLMNMNKDNKHACGKGKRQQGLLMAIHI